MPDEGVELKSGQNWPSHPLIDFRSYWPALVGQSDDLLRTQTQPAIWRKDRSIRGIEAV